MTVGLIELEANKHSQHEPQAEANNFYHGFLNNKANAEIYWTFNISVCDYLRIFPGPREPATQKKFSDGDKNSWI